MRQISKWRKSRILRRVFSGESYGYAAEKEGVSKSTVKEVYDEFMGRAVDSSLMETAKECDILEEIETLRELAVESKKADVSIPELLTAVRLSALMKRLDLSPVELQEHLEMYEEYRHNFGDFAQGATKLAKLEKKTGKTFRSLIAQYEETAIREKSLREDEEDLKHRVRNLREKHKTIAKKLESLDEKNKKAQRVSDRLTGVRLELATYGLELSDFGTVKAFLSEIQRLGQDPAKAVEILKKTSSFEAKLQEKIDQYRQLKQLIEDLEMETDKKNKTFRQLIKNEAEQEQKIGNLIDRRIALDRQVDGLLKKQAALLKVQLHIDLVSEALSARKKELEHLEQQIRGKATLIAAANAIAGLFAKKPYDRNAIIRWLQLTKHTAAYDPFDELARQTMVKLMANQGFVPTESLRDVKENVKKTIFACKEETEMWINVAEKRQEKLEACQEQLGKKRVAEDKRLDESINKKIANIAREIAKKAST